MNKRKIKLGEVYSSNKYGQFEILEYKSSRKVIVRFLQTGYITSTQSCNIFKGEVMDCHYPSVYGKGYLGTGKYNRKAHKHIYSKWMSMLQRCYSEEYHNLKPTYKGCTVCEEWLNFQNFAKWAEPLHIDGYHLDKDIKVPGNKMYSPETCIFVSPTGNSIKSQETAYSLLSPEGDVHIGVNIKEFCKKHSLDPSSISKVMIGKRKTHKGWKLFSN